MSCIDHYRHWFEHEKASNSAMLKMLKTVPEPKRGDPWFQRAVTLAAHLAACRENWLDRMINGAKAQSDWWPKDVKLEELPRRYKKMEKQWTDYLARLTDRKLDVDFSFPASSGKGGYRWNIEGQIVQLVGHAFYHRGQISLLVDQLGGRTVDTDYLFWAVKRQPERWKKIGWPPGTKATARSGATRKAALKRRGRNPQQT